LFDFGIALMAIFFEQLNLIRKSADQGAEWQIEGQSLPGQQIWSVGNNL